MASSWQIRKSCSAALLQQERCEESGKRKSTSGRHAASPPSGLAASSTGSKPIYGVVVSNLRRPEEPERPSRWIFLPVFLREDEEEEALAATAAQWFGIMARSWMSSWPLDRIGGARFAAAAAAVARAEWNRGPTGSIVCAGPNSGQRAPRQALPTFRSSAL